MASEDPASLAAEFRNGDGSDRWRAWTGVNGTVYGWLLKSSPPLHVYDDTLDGLRRRMAEVEKVLAETNSLGAARAAAQALET